jgi:hypothetical protein
MTRTSHAAWILMLAATAWPQPPPSEQPKPAQPDQTATPAAQQRTQLNLLGQTDASAGESRRNENVQFNLIDTNTVKELNVRLGTTATIIEEFRADRTFFGSEYGNRAQPPLHLPAARGSGIHGSLLARHGNNVFGARSFFQVGDVQPARENEYGITLAAPLWKAARFSIEGGQQKLRGNVNGNVLVPHASERTILATDPAVRALLERWLRGYPAQAPNRTDIDQRALNTNAPQDIDTGNAGARIDQASGNKDRLAWRYLFTSQQVDAFQFVAGQNPDTDTRSHTARLTWTRAFSAATAGDFSIGGDRLGTLIRPEENAVGPTVSMSRFIEGLGPAPPIPIDRAQNSYRFAAQISQRRGNHNLAAGFEGVRVQVNGKEQDVERGLFQFTNDFGRDAITNFRLGASSLFTQALGSTHRGYRSWLPRAFVDDTWRASPAWTLSLGLRYEPVTRPVEVNDIDRLPYPCDCNNLAPRFGFAHRLPASWGTLRGAYGIHYGEIFATLYGQIRMNPPHNFRIVIPNPSLLDPLAGVDLTNLNRARSGRFVVSPNLVTPYSHQYNFSWAAALPRNGRLQLGYVGSRTHKLFQMWFLNRARIVPGVPQTTATINDRRPDPTLSEVLLLHNASRGYFDAARVSLLIPRWRGFTIESAYWFSKALDLGNDYTSTLAGVDARRGRSQSENDVQGDLKARSAFDQPHSWLMRGTWDSPNSFGRMNGWGGLLRGWSLSGVLLLKQGTPFSVESGSDGPGFGNVDGQGSDRVHLLDPAVLGRTIGDPDTSALLLPRSAFAFMRPGEDRGNLGRFTFRRGKIANVNASLTRTWRLGSERRLGLRTESINLFNTPQFAEPSIELASPSFGRITNTLNDGRTFRFQLRFDF